LKEEEKILISTQLTNKNPLRRQKSKHSAQIFEATVLFEIRIVKKEKVIIG